MAGTIGSSGLRTVVFGANKSSAFGGFPVNTPPSAVAIFPAKSCWKLVEVKGCATSPSSTSRKPRGIMKPRPISPALQELVGAPEISRTQALKVIWAHIKANNLQDPNNKKIIVCDELLKKIFAGKERVGFLEISGLITPHLL